MDDHTRKVWVYFMKSKGEVFGHFKSFKQMVEKEIGLHIKCLRSDGGGEYFSHEFSRFLAEQGVKRQFTCRYTPQQNGVDERKNRHIAEVARALMSGKDMPKYYWAKAVHLVVYIKRGKNWAGRPLHPGPTSGLTSGGKGLLRQPKEEGGTT